MWGAMSGYDAIVQTLIEHGAKINSTNVNGDSALMLAARAGEVVVVEQLIENDASINIVNNANNSALIESIISGEHFPFFCFFWNGFFEINCSFSCIESDNVAEYLVQKGADVNFAGKDGKTAAMWAASIGSEIVVQALIDNAANINAVDEKNNSALIYAGQKVKLYYFDCFYHK